MTGTLLYKSLSVSLPLYALLLLSSLRSRSCNCHAHLFSQAIPSVRRASKPWSQATSLHPFRPRAERGF